VVLEAARAVSVTSRGDFAPYRQDNLPLMGKKAIKDPSQARLASGWKLKRMAITVNHGAAQYRQSGMSEVGVDVEGSWF